MIVKNGIRRDKPQIRWILMIGRLRPTSKAIWYGIPGTRSSTLPRKILHKSFVSPSPGRDHGNIEPT
ncbi:Protein of unknown function [Pyronema omphalodes CBS 100304]|uniref:Uncharacterized protein n=1 Tax=Pyronema omphalodes (strain CBS 100304) TaxID=1076935 RepID=U4KYX1_PYROM|nr:Protein of unknown function [Pyronema omphalodes CBS 100304]